MNNQEKLKIEDAMCKIERNINLLEYVHDSVIEGSGIMKDELFDGAVLEIILNLKESIDMMNRVVEEYKNAVINDSKTWQFDLYKYLTNNEVTAEQYLKICNVLGVSISELD